MYIDPGDLRKRISIIKITKGERNKNGFPTKSTEKIIRNCWAKVSDTSGYELIKANSEFSAAKKRFLIRYSETKIDTDMIVRYKGKDYDILFINPYGDSKEYVELWTKIEERV